MLLDSCRRHPLSRIFHSASIIMWPIPEPSFPHRPCLRSRIRWCPRFRFCPRSHVHVADAVPPLLSPGPGSPTTCCVCVFIKLHRSSQSDPVVVISLSYLCLIPPPIGDQCLLSRKSVRCLSIKIARNRAISVCTCAPYP